jgi:hypothetical protein
MKEKEREGHGQKKKGHVIKSRQKADVTPKM